MTIDPAIFRALVAQGATPEMLLAVVEADAAVREERLAKQRDATAARVRKHRAKDKPAARVEAEGNDGNALHTVTSRYAEQSPPNDIYSNPPENPDGAKAPCPPFSEKVVSVWNDGPATRGATKANPLDAGRRKALALRVRDHSEAAVLEAIANLAASEFHCGKNDRGWRVNIGWMLKSPENFAKALEMGGGKPGGPPAAPIDHAAYLAKLNDKPWLRGSQTETPAPSRNPTHGRGPTAVGDLIHRITDHAA